MIYLNISANQLMLSFICIIRKMVAVTFYEKEPWGYKKEHEVTMKTNRFLFNSWMR